MHRLQLLFTILLALFVLAPVTSALALEPRPGFCGGDEYGHEYDDEELVARGFGTIIPPMIEFPSCSSDAGAIPNVFRPNNPIINVLRNGGAGVGGDPTTDSRDGLPQVAALGSGGFRTWVEFAHSDADSSATNGRYDARAVGFTTGLEYTLANGVTLASVFGREDLDLDAPVSLGGNLDGRGYTVAPYLTLSFMEHWQVSLMGGYTWLDYDVRGTSDDPDGQRLFTSGGIVGNFEVGDGFRLSPEATIWYAEQATDGFTDSTSANVRSDRSDFGRASAGGELGYPLNLSIGRIEPYVRLMAELDFDDDDRVTLASGQTFSRDDFGFVAGAGLNASLSNRLNGRLEWTSDSISRDDLDAWTFRARFKMSF